MIVGSGAFAQLVVAAGVGPAWWHGGRRVSVRADLLARFQLDPFREAAWGLYAAGGLSALDDGFEAPRALLTLLLGAELPSRARGGWAVEIGLGGGVRAALILRRGVRGRR
jgi:hypothetical protein